MMFDVVRMGRKRAGLAGCSRHNAK
jgi:hypothetical protein